MRVVALPTPVAQAQVRRTAAQRNRTSFVQLAPFACTWGDGRGFWPQVIDTSFALC